MSTSYISDSALNDAATNATRFPVEIRLHTGDPSENGQQHPVGGSAASITLQPDAWTPPGDRRDRIGRCENKASAHFGILNTVTDLAVRCYSWWVNGTFKGWAQFEHGPIEVPAGTSFSANPGAIAIAFSRADADA